MKNLQYIFLALVLPFGGSAFASSKVTVEAGVVANIASAMRLFEKMNGHLPTNWMQISQIADLNVLNRQSLINSPAYPLQEHYVVAQVIFCKSGEHIKLRAGLWGSW